MHKPDTDFVASLFTPCSVSSIIFFNVLPFATTLLQAMCGALQYFLKRKTIPLFFSSAHCCENVNIISGHYTRLNIFEHVKEQAILVLCVELIR